MGKELKDIIKTGFASKWARGLTVFSLLLIIASFLLPPMAIIDSSVLAALGEILGFGTLITFTESLERGMSAKVRHNETELEINKDNNKDNIEYENE